MERDLVVAVVDVDLGDHVVVPDGCIDCCLVQDDMKTSYHVAVQPAGIKALLLCRRLGILQLVAGFFYLGLRGHQDPVATGKGPP